MTATQLWQWACAVVRRETLSLPHAHRTCIVNASSQKPCASSHCLPPLTHQLRYSATHQLRYSATRHPSRLYVASILDSSSRYESLTITKLAKTKTGYTRLLLGHATENNKKGSARAWLRRASTARPEERRQASNRSAAPDKAATRRPTCV